MAGRTPETTPTMPNEDFHEQVAERVNGLASGKYARDQRFSELVMENNQNWNPQNRAKLQKKQDTEMVTDYFREAAREAWDARLNPSTNEQDARLPICQYPSDDEARSTSEHERTTAPAAPSAHANPTTSTETPTQEEAHSANGQAGC